MIMWYVYILKCSDNSYYVGHTDNPDRRLKTHNFGQGPRWTVSRLPVKLVYQEKHDDQTLAIGRERQIKKWNRAKKEALIAGDLQKLKSLSKCCS
jgi:putative endonuclease